MLGLEYRGAFGSGRSSLTMVSSQADCAVLKAKICRRQPFPGMSATLTVVLPWSGIICCGLAVGRNMVPSGLVSFSLLPTLVAVAGTLMKSCCWPTQRSLRYRQTVVRHRLSPFQTFDCSRTLALSVLCLGWSSLLLRCFQMPAASISTVEVSCNVASAYYKAPHHQWLCCPIRNPTLLLFPKDHPSLFGERQPLRSKLARCI